MYAVYTVTLHTPHGPSPVPPPKALIDDRQYLTVCIPLVYTGFNPFGTREKKFFKLDNFLDVIRNGKTNALHIYRILISYLRADL